MKDFVRIETLQQTLSPPLSMRKIPVHMPMSNQFPYIDCSKKVLANHRCSSFVDKNILFVLCALYLSKKVQDDRTNNTPIPSFGRQARYRDPHWLGGIHRTRRQSISPTVLLQKQ